MSEAFDKAEFYNANDSDTLTHESPEEAILEYLDTMHDPRDGKTAEQQIIDLCPIEVVAYVREEIADEFVAWLLERLADQVEKSWAEDYGNTEEHDELPVDAKKAFAEAIRPHVAALMASKPVYRCKQIAERDYTKEEVLALAKEEWPEEFGLNAEVKPCLPEDKR